MKRNAQKIIAEPFWVAIGLFWLIAGFLYINHLATDQTPDRVALHIAPLNLNVYWYGIVITAGILLGAWVVTVLADQRGMNPEHVWNGVIYCIIFGVIGARLYHVLTPPPSMAALGIHSPADYFRQPLQLINLRAGGLGIYGGIIGGALGMGIYALRHHISLIKWADLAVVGLALGQSVGRWGNFINQELFGAPTNLPWGVAIDPRHRPDAVVNESHFHPAFLYESLWSFGVFLLLYWLAKRLGDEENAGTLVAAYLLCYGLGRILTELTRLDSPTILNTGIPIASGVSGGLVLAAGLWLWQKRQTA